MKFAVSKFTDISISTGKYMSILTFKRANYQEMSIVAELIRSSAHWYEPFLAKKDLKEHYVGQEWIDENFHKREFYLVSHSDKKNVGMISLQFEFNYTYLGYVYLCSKQVGKGYGKHLLDFAKKHTIEKSMDGIGLLAHPQAHWALKAYEKYGFKKILTKKDEILSWNNKLLRPYYEEGFELYTYDLK